MTFAVPIRIDDAGSAAVIGKVTTELDRMERAGKAAGDAVSKAMAEGKISAEQEADAVKRLTREFAAAEVAAEKASQQAQSFESHLKQLTSTNFGALNAQISGAVSGLGDIGLAGNAIGGIVGHVADAASAFMSWHLSMLFINDSLIEMRNRLRNVTDGQMQLGFAMANTQNLADQTFTSWKTTGDVFARMSKATNELGLDQQHVIRLTKTLSESFQASGKSAQENASAMLQLSQALGSGVLQGDEFRSISENAPQLLDQFARELHVTRGALKQLSSDGKITTDVMIAGLDHMAESADRAFNAMERTMAQRVQPLMNELEKDPMKLAKASNPYQNPNDLVDVLQKESDAGLLHNELIDSALGVDGSLEAGKGQWADLGREILKTTEALTRWETQMGQAPAAGPALEDFGTQMQRLLKTTDELADPVRRQQITAFADDMTAGIGRVGPAVNAIDDAMGTLMAKGIGALFNVDVTQNILPPLDQWLAKLVDIKNAHEGLADTVTTTTGTLGNSIMNLSVRAAVELGKMKAAYDKSWDGFLANGPHHGLSELEKLFHSIVDPVNHFHRDLTNLDILFKAHRITVEQYNATLIRLVGAFDKTHSALVLLENDDGKGFFQKSAGAIGIFIDGLKQATENAKALRAAMAMPEPEAQHGLAKGMFEVSREGDAAASARGIFDDEATAKSKAAAEATKKWNDELAKYHTGWNDLRNTANQAQQQIEDGFVKMFETGKTSWKSLFNMLLHDLTQLAAHRLFNAATGGGLFNAIGGDPVGGHETGGATIPHSAYGGDWRIGGSSTVGDKVPFAAMVNSGETVSIRPANSNAATSAPPIVHVRNVIQQDPRALVDDAIDTPYGHQVINRIVGEGPHRRR